MKELCILGIPNRHNIHNLKYRQNSTSDLPQINVHYVPNQHIIFITCSGGRAQPVWSRLCQIRLHHVFYQVPNGDGARLAGLNKLFFEDLILVNQLIRPSSTGLSIGQDRPNRLRRGPIVLPTPLCKRRPRLLKSDQYILVYVVPKMAS